MFSVKKIFGIIGFLSFLAASFSVGAIFYINISADFLIFFAVSFFSFILSLVVLKTDLFIARSKEVTNRITTEIFPRSTLKKREAIPVFVRLCFFNVLNDLFMVLVCWLAVFFIAVFFGFVIIKNIINFVYVLSLLGIISGFYQYYIKNYRENITNKIASHLVELIYSIISRKISFKEFLAFLENRDPSFYKVIKNETRERRLIAPLMTAVSRTPGKEVHFPIIYLEALSDHQLFAIAENSSEIDKSKLKTEYEKFFELKTAEIKDEIKKRDVSELRKLLLPHIQFFDDLKVKLLAFEETITTEGPKTYQDFYKKVSWEATLYLVELLLAGGEYNERQAKSQ